MAISNQLSAISLSTTEFAQQIINGLSLGAFYALMRVNSDRPEMELIEALIRDHDVAIMPGSTFGTQGGCHLRIAYGALDQDTVAAGMGRLVRGLQKLI